MFSVTVSLADDIIRQAISLDSRSESDCVITSSSFTRSQLFHSCPTLTPLWLSSVSAALVHQPTPSLYSLTLFSSLQAQTTSPRRCLSNPVFHHSALSSLFSDSHRAISHRKSSNHFPLATHHLITHSYPRSHSLPYPPSQAF